MKDTLSLDFEKDKLMPLKQENLVFSNYRGSYNNLHLLYASFVGREKKGGGHLHLIPLIILSFLILIPIVEADIVRDIEIDPNEVWIKYGQEIIDSVDVLESNSNANVFVITQEQKENFDDLSETQTVESSGLNIVTSSATNTVEETTQQVKRLLSGGQIVGIIGMVLAFLTIIIICFTIYKIKLD